MKMWQNCSKKAENLFDPKEKQAWLRPAFLSRKKLLKIFKCTVRVFGCFWHDTVLNPDWIYTKWMKHLYTISVTLLS